MRNFKPTLLSTVLLAAIALPAAAQDRAGAYDDRWYVTGGAGANIQDSSRDTENAPTYALGVGKFINPNWSVDFELNHQNPKLNPDEDLNWSQYGASLDARRHWRTEGRAWNPYVLMGVGYGRSEEEFNNFPSPDSPGERTDSYPTAKLGAGIQGDFDRFSMRGELYARASFDDHSVMAPGESSFTDGIAQISVIMPLGERRGAQVQPTPAPHITAQPVHERPDDYYDAPAMSLELPTVYFEFDRAELTNEGPAALDEAAATLRDNPSLRAEIAGHTDSKGSRNYNQALSERRAQVAYDYLIRRGVDRNQLEGPVGYGEDRPAAPTTHNDGSDTPQGRAKNRRTEVNPLD